MSYGDEYGSSDLLYYMLSLYVSDPSSILPLEVVNVEHNMTYEKVPIEILDRQVKDLKNKDVVSVKVIWRNQQIECSTWEVKADMKK